MEEAESLNRNHILDHIDTGHNIANVSKQLGHKSIKITVDTYYKWIEGAHSSQVAELDELGRNASKRTSGVPRKN